MNKRVSFISLAVILVIVLLVASCGGPSPAPAPAPAPAPSPAPTPTPSPAPTPTEKIVLKAVSFMPKGHMTSDKGVMFVEMVEERAAGKLEIDFLGGPEVVPTFEQPEAVRSGVVDINFSCGNYYTGIVPEADASIISPYEPWEDYETGFYDFMVEVFDEAGIRYLGNHGGGHNTPYYLFTNTQVETPWDLAGQKFRTVPLYIPFLTALGISPITMPGGEIYLAMERGTIDGFAWPIYSGFVEMGLDEVTKYCIDYPFYRGEMITTVNMDSWNRLPKDMQDLLVEISLDLEHRMAEHWGPDDARERSESQAAGMEFLKFSQADGEAYLTLAYDAKWDDLQVRCTTENYSRLEALLNR